MGFDIEPDGTPPLPVVELVTGDGQRFANLWNPHGTIDRVRLKATRPAEWTVEGTFEGAVTEDGETGYPISGEFAAETAAPGGLRNRW